MNAPSCDEATFGVLAEVAAERARQDAKWGKQDYRSVSGITAAWSPDSRAKAYGIDSEEIAKHRCQSRFANGVGTYADIAIEEVAEAICAPDDDARRAELVQVAAVAVAWIEAIDRRRAAEADVPA